MAQARKVRRKSKPATCSRPVPGWVWLLAGLLIGLGVAATLYLQGADRSPDLGALFGEPQPVAESSAPAAAEPEPAPAPEEPRFRYYELLPEDEIRVPESDRAAATVQEPVAPPPAATPQDGDPVILQTGSFRRSAQADAMRARIALLGLSPQVTEVEIDGETWYRVHVGPYSDEDRVRQALERLRSENIEALRLPHREG